VRAHVKRDYLFKLARTSYAARVEFLRTQPPQKTVAFGAREGGE
jgi:hypothetical protein